jgi:hypothetical protein
MVNFSDGPCERCRELGFRCQQCTYNLRHNPTIAAARATVDHFALKLETRAEQRIREIAREEISRALAECDGRDTIPAPVGDSHSGAIVVPRGSSNPPECPNCEMVACICFPAGGFHE